MYRIIFCSDFQTKLSVLFLSIHRYVCVCVCVCVYIYNSFYYVVMCGFSAATATCLHQKMLFDKSCRIWSPSRGKKNPHYCEKRQYGDLAVTAVNEQPR